MPEIPDDEKLHLISMRFSPFAERIHIILEAKSIPHHVINVNLKEKPEWLTELSPMGKVPALGLPNEPGTPYIYESLIIADYLDEKYPEISLYPTDPLAKALDRLLIQRFDGISPHIIKIIAIGGANEEALNNIFNILDTFETELMNRETPYFGGNRPNMVDYMILPLYERVLMLKCMINDDYEVKADRFPLLIQWMATILEDPAVKNNFISGEFHVQFFEGNKNGTADADMML